MESLLNFCRHLGFHLMQNICDIFNFCLENVLQIRGVENFVAHDDVVIQCNSLVPFQVLLLNQVVLFMHLLVAVVDSPKELKI